ncbi:MAG: hypothetical protein ACRC77_10425 [Bacteroidales bacterium]
MLGLEFDTKNIVSILYTISGIMFSVGLSVVATFNMQGVVNPDFVRQIRKILSGLLNKFIIYFIISSAAALCEMILSEMSRSIISIGKIKINISVFCIMTILYSVAYFIVNFRAIYRLNAELFDEINKKK